MEELADLFRELINKMDEVNSNLAGIFDKLDSIYDVVSKLDEVSADITSKLDEVSSNITSTTTDTIATLEELIDLSR